MLITQSLIHATILNFHGNNILISNRPFEANGGAVAEKENILGDVQSTWRLCKVLFNFMQTNIGPQDW